MDALLVAGIVLLAVALLGVAAIVVLTVVTGRRGEDAADDGDQVEPSLDDTCLVCVRPLAPSDEVAAMNEKAVLAFLGELPDDPPSYTDPLGNDRWFVHVDCAADFVGPSEADDDAEADDTDDDSVCVSCGKDIDPDEQEPTLDSLSGHLGDAAAIPMMAMAMASVHDATKAWQCEACGSWMCNDCVVARLNTKPAGRLAPHDGCGGAFRAPRA